jgi:GTP-binding protein HflX
LRSTTPNTPTSKRRVFLVALSLPGQPGFLVEEHLDELAELTRSADAEVVGRAIQQRRSPDPGTFVGRGKATEMREATQTLDADLVIFDDDLSPSQIKNLEEILELAVMDRSGLILEIFFQRARTREARTQVELAQLQYLLPRLTRRWSHLSRQVGGIGVRGGEGETQLEADRRMLRKRIKRLQGELEKIERTRGVQRRGRRETKLVALAGYTNAGKSTLFNKLTQAGSRVEDRLFATLDSKLRRGAIDGDEVVIFADTVGFIRKLPHHLVASFKSTLEELNRADIVLHVVDRSHPSWDEQQAVAEEVLESLGVESQRVIQVFNKSDRLGDTVRRSRSDEEGSIRGGAVWVSARTGEGLEDLKTKITHRLEQLATTPAEHPADTDRLALP